MTKARRWAPTVLASCFLFYFGVQFYCDFWRPEPMGALLLFESTPGASSPRSAYGAIVEAVAPDSPASRAGLIPSDQIRSVDGHVIATRLDWMAIDANIEPGRPLHLVVRRGNRDVAADLVLRWGRWSDWWAEGGGLLLTVRAEPRKVAARHAADAVRLREARPQPPQVSRRRRHYRSHGRCSAVRRP